MSSIFSRYGNGGPIGQHWREFGNARPKPAWINATPRAARMGGFPYRLVMGDIVCVLGDRSMLVGSSGQAAP